MPKESIKIAIEYGKKLQEFKDIKDAELFFLTCKDALLEQVTVLADDSPFFRADFTVDSLKSLEKWYFHIFEHEGFTEIGMERNDFEKVMAIYFGEVVVRNSEEAEWEIEEFPWGHDKYTFGVRQGYGGMTLSNGFIDHHLEPQNKRRNILYRRYNHFFKERPNVES